MVATSACKARPSLLSTASNMSVSRSVTSVLSFYADALVLSIAFSRTGNIKKLHLMVSDLP